MTVHVGEKPCRVCRDEYVWDDEQFSNEPGICFSCKGHECVYCGKYVRRGEIFANRGEIIHSKCRKE